MDGDNEQNVEEAEAAVLHEYEVIDLTEEVPSQQTQTNNHGRCRYGQIGRNPCLESSHRARSVYKFGDIDLKLGTCVELREPFGKWEVRGVAAGLLIEDVTDCSGIDPVRRDPIDLGFQG